MIYWHCILKGMSNGFSFQYSKGLSDKKAVSLFKTIATTSNKKNYTAMLITNLNLTRKQYYCRMQMMMDAGLVKEKVATITLLLLVK
jgi:hypothetical protein